MAGSAGVSVSVGTGGPAPTGVLPTEADSLGDTVDFWREGIDKDFGTVNKIKQKIQQLLTCVEIMLKHSDYM